MLTLLEIRRAEFNNSLENPLHDGISRLGGGVKYAWRKASRGKFNGLVSVPTSLKDDCKRGKYNGLVSQPTRHCEARRGNPVGITPSGFQPPAWLLALNGNSELCYETLSLAKLSSLRSQSASPSREGTKIRRYYANN